MSRDNKQVIIAAIVVVLIVLVLTGCTNTLAILDGATHACGNIHIEGYVTDTQGEVIVAKAPPEWTPDEVKAFCSGE